MAFQFCFVLRKNGKHAEKRLVESRKKCSTEHFRHEQSGREWESASGKETVRWRVLEHACIYITHEICCGKCYYRGFFSLEYWRFVMLSFCARWLLYDGHSLCVCIAFRSLSQKGTHFVSIVDRCGCFSGPAKTSEKYNVRACVKVAVRSLKAFSVRCVCVCKKIDSKCCEWDSIPEHWMCVYCFAPCNARHRYKKTKFSMLCFFVSWIFSLFWFVVLLLVCSFGAEISFELWDRGE